MRKLMAIAIVLTMGAGMAMADGAAMTAAAKPAKKEGAKKAKATKVQGTVTAVDAAGGKLSIKTAKGEMKDFTVGADAKIMKGSAKGALADVMVGDSVMVAYEMMGEMMMVKSVKIKAAPKAKK